MTETTTPGSTDTLDANTIAGLVANPRRRRLLERLGGDEAVALADVARRIAAEEREVPVSEVEECDANSVYVSLYQNHLPRLEEHGVVRYDRDERTVSLARSRQARQVLAVLGADDRPWSRHYPAATVVAGGLLVAAGLTGGTELAWRLTAGAVGLVATGLLAADAAAGRSSRERLGDWGVGE